MSSLTDLRWSLRRAGFAPLPLEGKRPILREWEKRLLVSLEEIMSWERFFPAAVNTGVLTKLSPAIDIDIMHPEAAEAVEALARDRFCEHGAFLVRIGKAPKKAILFRGEQPFKKITANCRRRAAASTGSRFWPTASSSPASAAIPTPAWLTPGSAAPPTRYHERSFAY